MVLENSRTYDRVFMGTCPRERKLTTFAPSDRIKDGEFDDLRRKKYADLAGTCLSQMCSSMHPNQGYEVRVWIVPHSSDRSPLRELPVEVEWSAGEKFRRSDFAALQTMIDSLRPFPVGRRSHSSPHAVPRWYRDCGLHLRPQAALGSRNPA